MNVALDHRPIAWASDEHVHVVIAGDMGQARLAATHTALVSHYPNYERDCKLKTRITLITTTEARDELTFEFAELFDNSFWRTVDLRGDCPKIESHRPHFDGRRKEFVDVEWEFVIASLSNSFVQEKLRKWDADGRQHLNVLLCYDDADKNSRYADRLSRRLTHSKVIALKDEDVDMSPLLELAKYLHYFYNASYKLKHLPVELPQDDVEEAWKDVDDITFQLSNMFNVLTIPVKMRTLGHDSADWQTFYALTADEIEQLTATEHNRWSVERLIQGTRPCTDEEQAAVLGDISLKGKFKKERGAHFDLVAFSELGLDDSGLPVSRYDRDLTSVIPLIVKSYADAHHG